MTALAGPNASTHTFGFLLSWKLLRRCSIVCGRASVELPAFRDPFDVWKGDHASRSHPPRKAGPMRRESRIERLRNLARWYRRRLKPQPRAVGLRCVIIAPAADARIVEIHQRRPVPVRVVQRDRRLRILHARVFSTLDPSTQNSARQITELHATRLVEAHLLRVVELVSVPWHVSEELDLVLDSMTDDDSCAVEDASHRASDLVDVDGPIPRLNVVVLHAKFQALRRWSIVHIFAIVHEGIVHDFFLLVDDRHATTTILLPAGLIMQDDALDVDRQRRAGLTRL